MKPFAVIVLLTAGLLDVVGQSVDNFLAECEAYRELSSGAQGLIAQNADKALAHYQKAAALNPELARAYYGQADAYFMRNDFPAGEAALLKAAVLEPDYPYTYYYLACVAARKGEKDKALAYLGKALDLGYARWDKLAADSDFKALSATPEWKALLKSHQEKPVKPSPKVAFLLMEPSEQLDLLMGQGGKTPANWEVIANEALLSGYEQMRMAGYMHFITQTSGDARRRVLIRALHDPADQVREVVGERVLMEYEGREALPYLDAILQRENSPIQASAKRIRAQVLQ